MLAVVCHAMPDVSPRRFQAACNPTAPAYLMVSSLSHAQDSSGRRTVCGVAPFALFGNVQRVPLGVSCTN